MTTLNIAAVGTELRPTALWATTLLRALARGEVAGHLPERLTEPQLATWTRFRGRLTSTDLVALLFEDAAVAHNVPFDPAAFEPSLRLDRLTDTVVDAWLQALPRLDLKAPTADFVAEQARALGLSTRLGRSDLHVVKAHQKVLELPGTGGQLAHHLVTSQTDLKLQDNFVIACSTWQELTLAGIVGLELRTLDSTFAVKVELNDLRKPEHPLRQRRFDFVVGLHPDKGGLFRVEDQLAIWFSNAKILLV